MTDTNQSSIRPHIVLMANLGRAHSYRDDIAAALLKKGLDPVYVNLREQSFADIDFSQVAAVDLKSCRGWQRDFGFFSNVLAVLKTKLSAQTHTIPVINPPEMFEWVYSKEYLKELEKKNIPVVTTQFVHRDDTIPDIDALIEKTTNKRIVLKPAIGSRAADINFIKKLDDGMYEVTCPKPRSESVTPHVITLDRHGLDNFIKGYKEKVFEGKHQTSFLIQDHHEGVETSAVFMGNQVFYVKRSCTPECLVAHEDYGGTNTVDENPDPTLVKLASDVRKAMPKHLQNAPYFRVDMLHDGKSPPVLLEIEAGSARLFLKDAGKIEDYADMVYKRVAQAYRGSNEQGRQ